MDRWRLVGRAILAGLDAMAAGVVVGALAFFLVPVLWVGDRVVLAATAAGLAVGVTLAGALALARLGRRPFPATRLGRAAFRRLPWWW